MTFASICTTMTFRCRTFALARRQHHNQVLVLQACRSLSSSSSSTKQTNPALKYLETWVGNTPTSTNSKNNSINQQRSAAVQQQAPPTTVAAETIHVTGSSYLLPTIRLPRSITSSTVLNSQLESFFDATNRQAPNAIRAMLRPKPIQLTNSIITKSVDGNNSDIYNSNKKDNSFVSWRVPIILDLKAFQHDGSPHYKPPPPSLLRQCVSVLDKWGISVIGVCNVQQGDSRDLSMVEQVIESGLPVLMSKVGRTLGGTLNKNGNHSLSSSRSSNDNNNSNHGTAVNDTSVGIEELVQIVTKHVQSLSVSSSSLNGNDGDSDNEIEIEFLNSRDKRVQQNEPLQPETDKLVTIDNINNMSFRDLQKECKKYNLGAKGSAKELGKRLAEYHDLPNVEGRSLDAALAVAETETSTKIPNDTQYIDDDKRDKNRNLSQGDSKETTRMIHPSIHAKVYRGNVRSGQQISTDEPYQSLIIIGNVSSGGEIMSDHDIHIYGALRGRALAGLSQNHNADDDQETTDSKLDSKIFASRFDPELVCIGSHFTTIDSVQSLGLKNDEGAMVSFDECTGTLKFSKF